VSRRLRWAVEEKPCRSRSFFSFCTAETDCFYPPPGPLKSMSLGRASTRSMSAVPFFVPLFSLNCLRLLFQVCYFTPPGAASDPRSALTSLNAPYLSVEADSLTPFPVQFLTVDEALIQESLCSTILTFWIPNFSSRRGDQSSVIRPLYSARYFPRCLR